MPFPPGHDPRTPEGRRNINKQIKRDMADKDRKAAGDPCAVIALAGIGFTGLVSAVSQVL